MLDRVKGEIVWVCDGDGCDEVLETGTDDFEQARGELRAERWDTRKVDGEWNHYCPGCKVQAVNRWWDD
jgi:hypothetical protein